MVVNLLKNSDKRKLFALFWLQLLAIFNGPLSFSLVCALVFFCLQRLFFKKKENWFKSFLPLLGLLSLYMALTSIKLNPLAIQKDLLVQRGPLFVKSAVSFLWALAFPKLFTLKEIRYVCEFYLKPLLGAKKAALFSFGLASTLLFLPQLHELWQTRLLAMRARGLHPIKLRYLSKALYALLAESLLLAENKSVSVIARGYQGHTIDQPSFPSKQENLVYALYIIALASLTLLASKALSSVL